MFSLLLQKINRIIFFSFFSGIFSVQLINILSENGTSAVSIRICDARLFWNCPERFEFLSTMIIVKFLCRMYVCSHIYSSSSFSSSPSSSSSYEAEVFRRHAIVNSFLWILMSFENGEKTCGKRQEIEEKRKDEREEKEARHEGGKRKWERRGRRQEERNDIKQITAVGKAPCKPVWPEAL